MLAHASALAGRDSSARNWGFAVRVCWGDQILEERFLRLAPAETFRIGTAPDVDFALADRRLRDPRFELVRMDADGAELQVPRGAEASLAVDGEWRTPEQVRGASKDEGVWTVPLSDLDAAVMDLGALRFEVTPRRVPRRVPTVDSNAVEYGVLNIALVITFIAVASLIGASARLDDGSAQLEESGTPPAAAIEKLRARVAPLVQRSELLERLERAREPTAGSAAPNRSGAAGSRRAPPGPKRSARVSERRLEARSAPTSVLGGPGLGAVLSDAAFDADVKDALGALRGPVVGDARGVEALGLRDTGDGPGGGGLERASIGGIGMRGRSSGQDPASNGVGLPAKGPSITPVIEPGDRWICGEPGREDCGLDRDLIRKVIHDHRNEIRFCYERQLQRRHDLGGKVAIRFVIGPSGSVSSAQVSASSMDDPELELCLRSRVMRWVFPKPKAGGQVVVTYPFLFKRAGE